MVWNFKPGTKVYSNGKLLGYVIYMESELDIPSDGVLIYRVDGNGWTTKNITTKNIISKRIQLLQIKDPNPTFLYIYKSNSEIYKFSSINILENE